MEKIDFLIIGCGPAGTICAGILNSYGHRVEIIEKSLFPRFCIGESFLPQNMQFYEEAGLNEVFDKNLFQVKTGAEFLSIDAQTSINFADKSASGISETFQVERSCFDNLVAKKLIKDGVTIHFGASIEHIQLDYSDEFALVEYQQSGEKKQIETKFMIDASGLARVLPKFLGLNIIAAKSESFSIFNHIKTKETCKFDLKKILITTASNPELWFWTIPLKDNKYSIGLTGKETKDLDINAELLDREISNSPHLLNVLGDFEYIYSPKVLKGYSSSCETNHGEKFLILGNSLKFIDPVFSSGVTIAAKSASLAASILHKKFIGEEIDFNKDYFTPLSKGLNVFESFVNAWYAGTLQKIIYAKKTEREIRANIISILAGYAWDEENYFYQKTDRRLLALSKYI